MTQLNLERRPVFAQMKDEEIHSYLQSYIKEKFKPKSRFMIKVPENSKEDATQEIFIDLWNNRFNYDPSVADFSTYAYNRGRHVIKNVLTGLSKNNRIANKFNSLPMPSKSAPSGLDIAEEQDSYEFAFSKLSDFQKEVVNLRFSENKTVAEIAEVFNCSPQKIYQTISSLKNIRF
jgi:RNA polymerase sigma factor (sigma-70 family)